MQARTIEENLRVLHHAMKNGDQAVLSLRLETSGHSVTPYAIEDQGNGVFVVRVYDNNDPGNDTLFVEIDTNANTWNYQQCASFLIWDIGCEEWSGSNQDRSQALSIVPLPAYTEPLVCPWCHYRQSGANQIWVSGEVSPLLTDEQGRSIGERDDEVINEIPGASHTLIYGGQGSADGSIYSVPATSAYTITAANQTGTAEPLDIMQVGPGYVATVHERTLAPGVQDTLTISADGTQISYQAGDDGSASVALALDEPDQSHLVEIADATLAVSQTLDLQVTTETLTLRNNRASSNYDLRVQRNDANGEHTFYHADLALTEEQTHTVEHAAWDGSGSLRLNTSSADDAADTVVVLENQPLPEPTAFSLTATALRWAPVALAAGLVLVIIGAAIFWRNRQQSRTRRR
jgi:hypothetical protein